MISEGAKLRKAREAELKRRDKQRLAELASRIKHHRLSRRARIREIRALCRIGRDNLRARIKALRAETRDQLKATVAALRVAERDQCETSQRLARANVERAVQEARRELELERKAVRERYGRKTRTTAKERAQESVDEVSRNIPRELEAVWRRVAPRIKGTARKSRTEAFLQWVEENSDDVHAQMYEDADRDVERLIREHQEVGRRLRKGRRAYQSPEDEAGALASAVPF